MIKTMGNAFRILICGVLIFQLTGCGTLMYPERKGQKGGKIDAGVAILDGIGLLLFIIPGVIAFAVDFNNGTIYLPGTSRSSLDPKNIKQVKFDLKHDSLVSIEKIIQRETGYEVRLDQDNMKIAKLRSTDEMMARFAEALAEKQNAQVALLNK